MASLRNNDFLGYFYDMYIFYSCITGINLSYYDLSNLNIAYKEFSDKYEKNKDDVKEKVKGIGDLFFGFIMHLLKFIKYCDDTKQPEYFINAKIIYNEFCAIRPYEEKDFKRALEASGCDFEEAKEILKSAKRYRGAPNDPQSHTG